MKRLKPELMIGLGALLALSSAPVLADEPLTWEECLTEAAQRNADLVAGQHSIEKFSASYKGAYSNYFPNLSASANYNHTNSSYASLSAPGTVPGAGTPIVAGNQSQSVDQYAAGLTVSQNLFNGWQDQAKVDQGRASLDSTTYSVKTTSAQVRADLRNAFAKVLYEKELLLLDKDVAERRKNNEDLVELRFEGGNENKGNYLRSKASHRLALVDVAHADRDLEVAGQNLGRLLGRAPGISVSVRGKLETPTTPPSPDFKGLLSRNPAHLQAQADLRVAEHGITKSRSGYFPNLSFNGSVYRQDTVLPPQNTTWSVGLSLSVPVFSGLSTYYDLQSSEAERDRAQASLFKIEEQVMVTLKQTYSDFLSAIDQANAQEEAVQAAEVRSQIARSKYQNGLQSFEDWDLIENDLISQQQLLLSEKLQVISAEAAWEQATGLGVSR